MGRCSVHSLRWFSWVLKGGHRGWNGRTNQDFIIKKVIYPSFALVNSLKLTFLLQFQLSLSDNCRFSWNILRKCILVKKHFLFLNKVWVIKLRYESLQRRIYRSWMLLSLSIPNHSWCTFSQSPRHSAIFFRKATIVSSISSCIWRSLQFLRLYFDRALESLEPGELKIDHHAIKASLSKCD